ncbi:MAG: hypothetical protein U0Q16_34525 [Bryobacteraceae bacterium]
MPENPQELNAPSAAVPQVSDVAELRDLTTSLLLAVQAMQTRQARAASFEEALADVRAATRLMAAETGSKPDRAVESAKEECNCGGGCQCQSPACCSFDIVMTHVRVVQMQIEPADSNLSPFGEMEVRMFASIDGIGAVIPDFFGYLTLHKLINQQGVWSQVNRKVSTVQVPKGAPVTFTITVDAVEVEHQEPAAGRDEYGTASGTITLDCCCRVASSTSFEVDFKGGGQGGGTIEVKFSAVRVC